MAEAAPQISTSPLRSRRAILAGALGGIGALAATVIGGASRAQAAAGSPLIMGSTTNNAGISNTTLTTASSGTGLLVTQNGTGTALRGSAVGAGSIAGFFTAQNGTGISGVTGNPISHGVFGENNGAVGSGGAMRANGHSNHEPSPSPRRCLRRLDRGRRRARGRCQAGQAHQVEGDRSNGRLRIGRPGRRDGRGRGLRQPPLTGVGDDARATLTRPVAN
jgi:hypothetical protein